jgi:hypothetical protein
MKFIPRVLKIAGLMIGQGPNTPVIKGLHTGSVAFSTGSIGANSSTTVNAVIAGVSRGDIVIFNNESPGAGVPYIDSVYVANSGSITIGVTNSSTATFSRGTTILRYLWVDMT